MGICDLIGGKAEIGRNSSKHLWTLSCSSRTGIPFFPPTTGPCHTRVLFEHSMRLTRLLCLADGGFAGAIGTSSDR